MANAIPMLAGTDASGGYLLRDEFGPVLINGIQRESAVMALAQTQRINTDRETFPIYAGRPTAAFVAEGAAKGATGAEFTQLSVDVKKIATIVMYTQELLDDAVVDPTVLVNADVRAAFADLIDSHALARNSAGTVATQFNSGLTSTTSTVEYVQANQDALAAAVSSAMQTIEANGYNPNGLILASDARANLRSARTALDATQPLYTQGFNREPDTLYGLQINYSTNLQTFAGAAAAGRVIGLVGDFSGAYFVVRNDIQVAASNNATIDVSGTLHHLWQQNKVAVRWEMRLGFVAHDLNKRFVAILNAA